VFQFSCRFAFYQLFVFQTGRRKITPFLTLYKHVLRLTRWIFF